MKKMTYDQATLRLEEIVKKLEDENTPIEESLKLFKEGISLTEFCTNKLKDIENEITIIQDSIKEDGEQNA